MTKEELLARLTEIKARVAEIDTQYAGQYIDPASADGQEWNALNAEHDEVAKTVAQIEAREERLAALATDPAATGDAFNAARPGSVRGNDIFDLSTIRSSVSSPDQARAELHDRAMKAIDVATFPHERADQAKCQEHLERLLATVDNEAGELARRILVTGSPQYREAFGRALKGQANMSTQFMSALSIGSDPAGGFAVPFTLDPTVLPTSDGSVNPYRAISRVVQIVGTDEWRGLTSAGVTATRRSEAAESGDNSPTLAQPTVKAERVDVFVPFSIELQQDWGAMSTELARMIQDAKDAEEAASFTTGDGNAPNANGLITGATLTVTTGATASFQSTDLDLMENDLGSRFQQRAQWVANRAIYNLTRHFASNDGPDLWVRIAEGLEHGGNTGRTLLGYRANEASEMVATHATNDKFLVLGDFSYFLIVDRVGMSIELVQHLMGSNRRPTGQRGFYAYWRNNCKVLAPEAFRVLKAR